MADEALETARKVLAEDKARRDKAKERVTGKPTPTQEENDLAMLGAHVHEKAPDGSPPDRYLSRALQADKPAPGGGYQTRTGQPTR